MLGAVSAVSGIFPGHLKFQPLFFRSRQVSFGGFQGIGGGFKRVRVAAGQRPGGAGCLVGGDSFM